MKIFYIFLITLVALQNASAAQVKLKISLDQVIEIISEKNYLIQSKAMNVYQAKQTVAVARGNLLPHLHVWSFIGVPLDITNLPSVVEQVLPFLVPNNWFRLDEQKSLAKAEFEGYRTIWANEVVAARTLFLQIKKDMALYDTISDAIKLLKQVLPVVQIREKFGGANFGIASDINVRILSLEADLVDLKTLINIEIGELDYLLGFPDGHELELIDPTLEDISTVKPINSQIVAARAVEASTELKQLGYLVEASKVVENEPWWAFLGLPQSSRGESGSVFDSLPVQHGFGFGTVPSVRISKAQTAILETSQVAIRELEMDRAHEIVDRYNAILENHPKHLERVQLAKDRMSSLMTRIKMGGFPIDPLILIEASRNVVASESAYAEAQYRFMIEKDRLNRLTLQADYDRLPQDDEIIAKQKMENR